MCRLGEKRGRGLVAWNRRFVKSHERQRRICMMSAAKGNGDKEVSTPVVSANPVPDKGTIEMSAASEKSVSSPAAVVYSVYWLLMLHPNTCIAGLHCRPGQLGL